MINVNSFRTPSPKKQLIASSLILLIGFSIYFGLLVQGIPYEQEEGVTWGWAEAAETPWSTLLGYLFHPKSNRIVADGPVLISVRVTESLVHKFIDEVFGQSMTAMAVYKIGVDVLFAVFVLWIAYRVTGHVLISLITSAYLMFTPAYGWNAIEYGAYSPSDQLLLVSYFLFFAAWFKQTLTRPHDQNGFQTVLKAFGLWFLGMLAIRAKEPNMFLIPTLTWLMLFLNPAGNLIKASRTQRARFLSMAFIALLLTLPMVWKNKPPDESPVHWLCPFTVFWWNTEGWEPETTPCLFTLERIIPVSILSNFGFFLGWILIAAAIHVGMAALKNRLKLKEDANREPFCWPLLLLGWFAVCETFFIKFCSLQFIRHQAWILLPFALLVALLLKHFISLWRGRVKILVVLALVIFIGEKLVDNVGHSIFVRQHLERLWITKWYFREEIYKELHQVKEVPLFDLYDYWHTPPEIAKGLFPFMDPESEKQNLLQSPELETYLDQYKTAYLVSSKELKFPEGLQGVEIREIDMNRMSALTYLKKHRPGRAPRPYYLYRVTR